MIAIVCPNRLPEQVSAVQNICFCALTLYVVKPYLATPWSNISSEPLYKVC